MKIATALCGIVVVFAVTSAWADEPKEGALFWWEMGVLTTVQSRLAACNEIYPVFAPRNDYAYSNSVFANSVYDAALRQYPDKIADDPVLNRLFDAALEGKRIIKSGSPQVQHPICSEFPEKIEETTLFAFGMSSAAIKQRFAEKRKSSDK